MTDDELCQLVAATPPDELSLEMLQLLRDRVRTSPDVRLALRDQLAFEQSLCETYAPIALAVPPLIQAASGTSAATTGGSAASSTSSIFGWGVGAMVVSLVASMAILGVVALQMQPPAPEPGEPPVFEIAPMPLPAEEPLPLPAEDVMPLPDGEPPLSPVESPSDLPFTPSPSDMPIPDEDPQPEAPQE